MEVNWKAVFVALQYGFVTGLATAVSAWAVSPDTFEFSFTLVKQALLVGLVGGFTNVRNLLAQPPQK